VQLDRILPHLIAAGLIILISFPVHVFAHAWTAWRLGDSTARLFGRLTLNPIVHFDPVGGILLVLSSLVGFGVGWAKPTPVNPNNLRGGRWSEAVVAAAGPLSNLVIASIAAGILRIMITLGQSGTVLPDQAYQVVLDVVVINIALLLFNFIPVPPLDGSKVLYGFLSPRQQYQWRPVLEQYGFLLLIVVAFLPILPGGTTLFQTVFERIGGPLINFLVGIEVM
jgi:Zn-dependent protease